MKRFSLSSCTDCILYDEEPLIFFGDLQLGTGLADEGREFMANKIVESLNKIDDFPSREKLEKG